MDVNNVKRKSREMSSLLNESSINIIDENTPLFNRGIHYQKDYYDRTSPLDPIMPEEEAKSGCYTPVNNSFSSHGEVRPMRAWQLPHKDYDSLDYDICYNVPYKERLRSYTRKTYCHMEVVRWVLVCIIGVLTGFMAFLIDICVKRLFSLKYGLFGKVLDRTTEDGHLVLGFLVLLGFNVGCAFIAALLIAFEPVAAGSGIPEIKCYLNGVKVPHVTRIGTLAAKTIGVLFSVAGGFLVGKEGPMIHGGSIIGAGLPQFRSLYFKWLSFSYPYFRSDRDKRDFVSSGAAAGVAAAFGSPIGGVLFSLEEGSSFWNQALTWKTLFCCFSATFTLNFLVSAMNGDPEKIGFLASPGLVDFGVFDKNEANLWNTYHLIIFIAMGAVGGLLGALFNSLNINLTKYRMKYLSQRVYKRSFRVAEVILIAMVTTSAVFVVALALGTCIQDSNMDIIQGDRCDHINSGYRSFVNETKDFFCPGHATKKLYYNDMATLMFNSQETGIKQLFHQNGAFTLMTLLILFIVYFFVACWTYGAGIPSGLFIPCLMIGATYGRFVATVFIYLARLSPSYFGWLIRLYPGTYALIGAASFLGGVVRMTISLTVILIESTNEIEYGLPIMLTVMVAKWVGDIFNRGIYDTHIELKKTPFLEWESPRQLDKLIAEDVMNSSSSALSYLYPITRVRSIQRLLRTTAHSAFLVVTPCKASSIPVLPKSVMKTIPQLYTRPSMKCNSKQELKSCRTGIRNPDTEELKHVKGMLAYKVMPTLEDDICESYSLPVHKMELERGFRYSPLLNAILSGSISPGLHGSFWKLFSYGRLENTLCPFTLVKAELLLDGFLGWRRHGNNKEEEEEEARTYSERKVDKDLLVFRGLILRDQLIMLLKNKIFFDEGDGPESQTRIDHLTLTSEYPRYSDIFSVQLSLIEQNMLLDLSLFMNPSPYTISKDAPLPQVFNLFRTMGLRHLPVIQESGIVAGIITRHDLTHEKLHEIRHRKKSRECLGSQSYHPH